MLGAPARSPDSSRSGLEFAHRLLTANPVEQPDLSELLGQLASAFAAPGAGLANLRTKTNLALHPPQAHENHPPGWEDSSFLTGLSHSAVARTVLLPDGGSRLVTLLTVDQEENWLLWLEDPERAEWTAGEAAALVLVGHALDRLRTGEGAAPRWVEQLERSMRRQRLEAAADLVRRLAHDFGNVLTGILGFSELALTQPLPSGSPLHAYLTEIHRGAQNGSHYLNQLRLFARRQSSTNRSCHLSAILAEEANRLRSSLGADVQLELDVPADLPAAGLDAEHLRQALAVALENAREAIRGPGLIRVSARLATLSAADAASYFGNVRSGDCLEITVSDTGAGLSADTQRHLFAEPFFSTKPRKRGFGLAIAYGALAPNRGGIELLARSEGGALARIVVPVVAEAPAAPRPAAGGADRVLVVDDDPMILQFVTTTLERAGYRVQAATSAEEAMRTYTGAAKDPFRLVLSDVRMPHVSGVDLANRLLALNADVRVLFMSGQTAAEFSQQSLASGQFELLPKPFRPEGLIGAVRAALDGAASRCPSTATR